MTHVLETTSDNKVVRHLRVDAKRKHRRIGKQECKIDTWFRRFEKTLGIYDGEVDDKASED